VAAHVEHADSDMSGRRRTARPELLAPAGERESACAAIAYGADAVYVGLRRFSARAEAGNFSADELAELVAYAHAQKKPRRVYVALNTLLQSSEMPAMSEAVADVAEAGADALIVQDLGVARFVRRHFPQVRLHGSTQMAVHNLNGALAAAEMGFSRVTLARELDAAETARIAAGSGIETECFIHGAMCYSYSGLCLFSSMEFGDSGNRGRCKYPCRSMCRGGNGRDMGLPYSMKDMARLAGARELAASGVVALKIEGRMKSPLYVAAAVDYYRRLLDGDLTEREAAKLEDRIRTIFSRRWTDPERDCAAGVPVVDPGMTGHRGAPVGTVVAVRRSGQAHELEMRTIRPVERHDGLQVELEGDSRPYGFAVDSLRAAAGGKGRAEPVFRAEAGQVVLVGLPKGHPGLPAGAPVYLSSSQEVKRSYSWTCPRRGDWVRRSRLDVEVTISESGIRAAGSARVAAGAGLVQVGAEVALPGPFHPSRGADMAAAVSRAFGRLGGTSFEVGSVAVSNPAGLFVPVSLLNELRRGFVEQLDERARAARDAARGELSDAASVARGSACRSSERWIVKTSDPACAAAALESAQRPDEVILELESERAPGIEDELARMCRARGCDLRLALPMVARRGEDEHWGVEVERLAARGFHLWQAGGVWGMRLLARRLRGLKGADTNADWPVYVLNGFAAEQVLEMGASGFTVSPEDSGDNIAGILRAFGASAVVPVYQDVPLLLSAWESGLDDGSTGTDLKMGRGVRGREYRSAIGTVFVRSGALCLADRIDVLRRAGGSSFRVDFRWRPYDAREAAEIWRRTRAGEATSGFRGNFDRGLA